MRNLNVFCDAGASSLFNLAAPFSGTSPKGGEAGGEGGGEGGGGGGGVGRWKEDEKDATTWGADG